MLLDVENYIMERTNVIDGMVCWYDKDFLQGAVDMLTNVLRDTMLGRSKFSAENWKRITEVVLEVRANEILEGIRFILKKEILGEKDLTLPADDLQQLVKAIIRFAPDENGRNIIDNRVAVYNIRTRNRLDFVKGRLELKEVEGSNMMIVALGGYFCIAKGIPKGTHMEDRILSTRCTKISAIHKLAANGKVYLPAGVTKKEDEAILPIPLKGDIMKLPKNELNRALPMSIMKNQLLNF